MLLPGSPAARDPGRPASRRYDVRQRYLKDESVDLVYLDPPFNSRQDYNVLFAEKPIPKAAGLHARTCSHRGLENVHRSRRQESYSRERDERLNHHQNLCPG